MFYEALNSFNLAFNNIFMAIYDVLPNTDAGFNAFISTAIVGEIVAFLLMKYGFYVRDKKRGEAS